MTRMLLIRHGESTWNADGRWQGQADPPLSDRGREQAAEAAARVGSVDAVVTSDLERASRTGLIIAASIGVDHVAVEPGLRERDAGPLSGLTRAEIHQQFPGLLADDPAGFRPGPDGGPDWPEGWEHDDELWVRLEVALTAVARAVPDGDVLAVTHGGVIYAIERRLGAAVGPLVSGPTSAASGPTRSTRGGRSGAGAAPGTGRPRLSNLDGVTLDVASDGRMVLGDRLSLVDPTHTVAIEADRI